MLVASLLCSVQLAFASPSDTTISVPASVDTTVMVVADSVQYRDSTATPVTGDLRSDISRDSVPAAAVTRSAGEFRPGALDMITNLPGDWAMWGKSTFTVENIPWIAGMGALTTGLVVTDYETWQPFKKWYEGS
ncbi:MAG: hypothetical protein ABIQ57_18680, partial [Candidatus Kapaibacterium sp.]